MDGPLRGFLDPWCRPGRMTTGNSNPLALWMVSTRTASSDSSARALSASSGCSDTLVIIRSTNPVKVRWGRSASASAISLIFRKLATACSPWSDAAANSRMGNRIEDQINGVRHRSQGSELMQFGQALIEPPHHSCLWMVPGRQPIPVAGSPTPLSAGGPVDPGPSCRQGVSARFRPAQSYRAGCR